MDGCPSYVNEGRRTGFPRRDNTWIIPMFESGPLFMFDDEEEQIGLEHVSYI